MFQLPAWKLRANIRTLVYLNLVINIDRPTKDGKLIEQWIPVTKRDHNGTLELRVYENSQ